MVTVTLEGHDSIKSNPGNIPPFRLFPTSRDGLPQFNLLSEHSALGAPSVFEPVLDMAAVAAAEEALAVSELIRHLPASALRFRCQSWQSSAARPRCCPATARI